MIRKLVVAVIGIGIFVAGGLWLFTTPRALSANDVPPHTGDPVNGERVFWAGGCASCHAAEGAVGDDRLVLGGGLALNTPFGTFRVPNISTDATHGIGDWSTLDFVNAMKRGRGAGRRSPLPGVPLYARTSA
jgi:mono/diheme cytochrome c family protein